MEEEFEIAFEDELDALNDFEAESQIYSPPAKSRRSLDFSTPSGKHVGNDSGLNDSCVLAPLEAHQDADLGPVSYSAGEENCTNVQRKSQKRRKEDTFRDMSDDEDLKDKENEILPSLAPHRKRLCMVVNKKVDDVKDVEVMPSLNQGFDIKNIRNVTAINYLQRNPVEFHQDRLTQDYDFERVRVLKRIPNSDFISVTGGSAARRFYMKIKDDAEYEKQIIEVSDGRKALSLLGIPLSVLKVQVEEQKYRRMIEESKQMSDSLHKEDVARRLPYSESDTEMDVESPEPALWVEKYAPKNYTQLLSDESTNRVLLKWLKQWDQVVFGKEKSGKFSKGRVKKSEQKQFVKKNEPQLTDELDEHNRPHFKVALLCGPPGLGKTTLAHVIAKHAGYNAVEMNASDDRSVEIFKSRIEAATQMRSVLDVERRPNCLIIDEIDGAPQPAIQMLLHMIKGPDVNKKKRKQQGFLLRPIICICNDLYVPALRQLRQVALVVNFPQTENMKLAARLLEVCKSENIATDMSTLIALGQKTDNDIRSCLNTLQFARGKGKELTIRNISCQSVGQKDLHKSLFSVWQYIFQLPKANRKKYINPYDRGTSLDEMQQLEAVNVDNTSAAYRFTSTLDMTLASGEYEKVAQGLYENYLQIKVKDPRMDKIQVANEWMCFTDLINQQIQKSQDYILGRFSPYLAIVYHLLFASNSPGRIQYPHSQFELHTKTTKSTNLVISMLNDVAPYVRKNLNIIVAVTEMLPLLLEIIQPTLRPVNTQLYSKREKEELKSLIKIMIAYNMTYNQERTLDGQYTYNLDPNIDEVAKFPGLKSQKQPLTYAAKQLISREIELEKMRRSEAPLGTSASKVAPPSQTQMKQVLQAGASVNDPASKAEAKKSIPTHLRQELKPKEISPLILNQDALDFFGRKIEKSEPSETLKQKELKREVIGGDIWFRFKEGYTNAVRKMVRIQDLL